MDLGPPKAPLKDALDAWLVAWDPRERLPNDPVELVHRYRSPADIEVAGLLASSLAYGRVDLFKPALAGLLDRMGPSPADFCRTMETRADWLGLEDFTYRFNRGADLGCLFWACGEALRVHGGLGPLFLRCLEESRAAGKRGAPRGGLLRDALAAFSGWLRGRDFGPVVRRLGPPRALGHLLPSPESGGACKRLNLYLRWMVRGPDAIDFGIWELDPSLLVVPLDTHLARMARVLGLTRRRDLSWKTAEEITGALRRLDPTDPTRYDFALCHFGMSGACPPGPRAARRAPSALAPDPRRTPVRAGWGGGEAKLPPRPPRGRAESCRACPLRPACPTGRRITGRR